MSTATATRPSNLGDYIKAHADADPKTLLDLVVQENERLREESKMAADVEIDASGQFKPKNLAGLWRLGQMFAQSGLVPDHYKNNVANCAIGCQMALRCKVDILTFLQSSYIVKGKPGIEAKLAIAMLNSSGKVNGRIRFKLEGAGPERSCTAYVTDAQSGDVVEQTVDWKMVSAEGWDRKDGSKWRTMPDLMFQYRSAMFLIRVSYPDVLMGMYSIDELEDTDPAALANPGPAIRSLDQLADQLLGGSGNGAGPEAEPPQQPGLAAGEIPNDSDPLLLDDIAAGFRACATLEEVGKYEIEASGRAKAEHDKSAIAGMAEEARNRVRATRGTRNNGGKQKELAGT